MLGHQKTSEPPVVGVSVLIGTTQIGRGNDGDVKLTSTSPTAAQYFSACNTATCLSSRPRDAREGTAQARRNIPGVPGSAENGDRSATISRP